MCVMTTYLSKYSICSDILDVPFDFSVLTPHFTFVHFFSTTRLSFVGMNKTMIGKALGLWNLVIYSKTVKTIPAIVLFQGICQFPSVITIFLSHESGRIMLTARLTL